MLDVVLADDFLEEVSRKGLLLKQGLAEIADSYPDVVSEIRGLGLMLGLKCALPNGEMIAAMRNEKLLAVGAGDNVIRLLPPLTLSDDEIRDAVLRIRNAAASVSVAAKGEAK